MRRGTGLIAGSPGATGSPARVTVPTPSPARRALAARQRHRDWIGKFSGHERGKSRFRRGGGAGASSPAPAQRPLLFRHVASFSPVIASRHYRGALSSS